MTKCLTTKTNQKELNGKTKKSIHKQKNSVLPSSNTVSHDDKCEIFCVQPNESGKKAKGWNEGGGIWNGFVRMEWTIWKETVPGAALQQF